MDIIKNIMDMSVNKRNTLFIFLKDDLKYKYRYYELKYYENLYVNDIVHCIRRDTLEYEHKGRIKHIDEQINIIYNGRNYYLDPQSLVMIQTDLLKNLIMTGHILQMIPHIIIIRFLVDITNYLIFGDLTILVILKECSLWSLF